MYHFTCTHSQPGIDSLGYVIPTSQITLGRARLSWWSILPDPERAWLGLSSLLLSCDRFEVGYEATSDAEIIPWPTWARTMAVLHPELRDSILLLEAAHGARPHLWGVAEVPVPVRRMA
jgi:hypothetical protein